MDVKNQIDILVELHRNDTDVKKVGSLLSGVSEKRRALEAQLASAVSAVEETGAHIDGLRKGYRGLESDVKVNLDLIRKSKSRLPSVKSNKEYQALLKQIEDTEKRNSRLEDEMLALLDQIEAGEKTLEERKQARLGAEERFESEKARLEAEVRRGEARLAELSEGRETIASLAPPELTALFEKTRKLVGEPVIVPVRGTTCDGCNINIPPQMANDLRRFESLNFCPFCNRLIYWESPLD